MVPFEAQGTHDIAAGKPTTKDPIFRIDSLTMAAVSVPATTRVEEGTSGTRHSGFEIDAGPRENEGRRIRRFAIALQQRLAFIRFQMDFAVGGMVCGVRRSF